jgi:hypothetical protein
MFLTYLSEVAVCCMSRQLVEVRMQQQNCYGICIRSVRILKRMAKIGWIREEAQNM